eukprot:GHVH01010980.1.p1 GENE.GHVH01010980.1~~GHVH01010980.1.p1  ORF type:complete len:596 (-),score=92.55 GHVH01010980.1:1001-2788(-)
MKSIDPATLDKEKGVEKAREEAQKRLNNILSSEKTLKKAALQVFRHFDSDQNQRLSMDEIRQIFRTLETALKLEKTSDASIYKLLSKFNYDEDGAQLTKDEFVMLYRNTLLLAREHTFGGAKTKSAGKMKIERQLFVGHQFLTGKPGETIQDRYNFIKVLGEGSFGVVQLAEDRCSKMRRCIKIIDKSRMDVPKDQIKHEIDVMKSLDHPNIVKIYEVFEDFQNMYIIMEYCEGGELYSHIRQMQNDAKKFTEKYIAKLMKQILQGVRYCHLRNVVHKDLKPQNLMLDKSKQEVKIIDFGVAEIFTSRQDSSKIGAGTLLYMAPEVFRKNVTLKSDIWSLGVILYNLAAGKYPYYGNSYEHLKKKVTNTEPPMTQDFASHSPDLKDLVSKMLQHKLNARWSADECLKHSWFKNAPDEIVNVDTKQEFSDKLKCFSQKSQLHAAIYNAVAHQLNVNTKDVRKAVKLFKSMDVDGDGELTRNELIKGLKEAGWEDDDVDRLLDVVDADGSGAVGISEFIAACYSWTERHVNVLWTAFQKLDKDGDGRLSVEEFAQVANDDGRFGSKRDIKKMLQTLDTNGDGVIDWQEFKDYMLQGG